METSLIAPMILAFIRDMPAWRHTTIVDNAACGRSVELV